MSPNLQGILQALWLPSLSAAFLVCPNSPASYATVPSHLSPPCVQNECLSPSLHFPHPSLPLRAATLLASCSAVARARVAPGCHTVSPQAPAPSVAHDHQGDLHSPDPLPHLSWKLTQLGSKREAGSGATEVMKDFGECQCRWLRSCLALFLPHNLNTSDNSVATKASLQ